MGVRARTVPNTWAQLDKEQPTCTNAMASFSFTWRSVKVQPQISAPATLAWPGACLRVEPQGLHKQQRTAPRFPVVKSPMKVSKPITATPNPTTRIMRSDSSPTSLEQRAHSPLLRG